MGLDKPSELAASARVARQLRLITASLYSAEADKKWEAVRALGELAARPDLLDDGRLRELLRRYFWSLNSESGAVPFGLPEAIGEALAQRPALQPEFLPLLCSLAYQGEMSQTGAILCGVIWALGRVGSAVAGCDPDAVTALRNLAANAPETQARQLARWALEQIEKGGQATCGQAG